MRTAIASLLLTIVTTVLLAAPPALAQAVLDPVAPLNPANQPVEVNWLAVAGILFLCLAAFAGCCWITFKLLLMLVRRER